MRQDGVFHVPILKEKLMKIKDAIEKRCPTCNAYIMTIEEEQHGCDFCKKVIDLKDDKYGNRESHHLEPIIFYKNKTYINKDSKRLTFCSWKCVFDYLKTLRNNKKIDFVSLPYLSFERDVKDKYCGDFFEYIK